MLTKTKMFATIGLTILLMACSTPKPVELQSNTEVKQEVKSEWGKLQNYSIQDAVYRARKIIEVGDGFERSRIYRQISGANCNDPDTFVSAPAILLSWAVVEPRTIIGVSDTELMKAARDAYDLYQSGHGTDSALSSIDNAICKNFKDT